MGSGIPTPLPKRLQFHYFWLFLYTSYILEHFYAYFRTARSIPVGFEATIFLVLKIQMSKVTTFYSAPMADLRYSLSLLVHVEVNVCLSLGYTLSLRCPTIVQIPRYLSHKKMSRLISLQISLQICAVSMCISISRHRRPCEGAV